MKTSRLIASIVLVAFVPHVGFAAPSTKPPPPAPSAAAPAAPAVPSLADSLTGEAKTDYESGKVYFNDRDFARAFLKFQSAYEKSNDARLLWNMAACQKEQRRYAKVIPLVERYLKEATAQITPDDKSSAEALLAAIRVGTTLLHVDVSEPDAELFLDDELIGKSPLEKPVLIDQGQRKLIVKKAGFDTFEKSVNAESAAISLLVTLTKTVHEGTLFVHAGAADTITIDGADIAQGVYNKKIQSGVHVLRVTAQGMRPFQGDVVVEDNSTRDIPITLDRAETKVIVPTWVWIVGSAVVVGVGVGLYFALKQPDKYNGPQGNVNPAVLELTKPFILRF